MTLQLKVIQEALAEQKDLSLISRFARLHDEGLDQSTQPGGIYESLIPLEKPKPGEQYSFHVDLDACTGCKACVVGCNKLNGLDSGEAWRAVGLVHGGTTHAPIQQTITTACHHCLDPACMTGCPVGAYEKSEETGIVKHLDDQCIGCQYCTLTCPYEVPQYNQRLGIVRKCDMCSERLAVGEEPACVASCPNGAISIRIKENSDILEDAQADVLLPGAPSSGITAPSTTYETSKPVPKNVLPANFYNLKPAAPHFPLVVMLVLTQLSVGAFSVESALSWWGEFDQGEALARSQSLLALGLGLVALVASVFHLGRPLYAFRAIIGLRQSWMSREILLFGVFVSVAMLDALTDWLPSSWGILGIDESSQVFASRLLGVSTSGVGLLAVSCSVMIYKKTQRQFWEGPASSIKFFGTTALLGLVTLCLTTSATGFFLEEARLLPYLELLLIGVIGVSIIKLGYEATLFFHLLDKQQGDLKRSALLMTRDLRRLTVWRFALGCLGGLILPALLILAHTPTNSKGLFALQIFLFATVLTAEVLERILYFRAVSAPRMPGSVGQ